MFDGLKSLFCLQLSNIFTSCQAVSLSQADYCEQTNLNVFSLLEILKLMKLYLFLRSMTTGFLDTLRIEVEKLL